ncbi:hypothetical protein SmJEL517_g04670 [Synchytrium microbalum]|uniref:GH26 domain-containing protein n=1 Tax=Synchytrium microbalum TaxID=1806994 RepID=A0A507C3R5_9FUNG|nr:uncharacterized protein SmJEL517_g04670 [Synchytrium microbalum]TPX32163.1 hypothetical protein SmJEL517_g04670 [Synchytrium microbalum]
MNPFLVVWTGMVFAQLASSAALLEPTNGKILLSSWLDYSGSVSTGDRTWKFDSRMGRNFSYFHFAVNLPIDSFPPYDYVGQSATDAHIFLSVYPLTLDNITDAQIAQLTAQCQALNGLGRNVLLRIGPDMNGYVGCRSFIDLFRRVSTAVRNATTTTAVMWAPSAAKGYPFLLSQYSISNTSSDFALLDTNHNGQLDLYDDPFSPYFPGISYIDWIGMGNLYHLGNVYPNVSNTLPAAGQLELSVTSQDQPNKTFNFYRDYVVALNKPFAIAETNAVFHDSPLIDVGPGEVAIKQAWWRQYLTNSTFLATYSQLKLINIFEFRKDGSGTENGIVRDYRVVSAAWATDFAAVASKFELASPAANVTLFGTTTTSSTSGSSSSPSNALWAILSVPAVIAIAWVYLAVRRKRRAHLPPSPPRDNPLLKYVPEFLKPKDKPATPGFVGSAELEAARSARLYQEYNVRYPSRRRDGRATPSADSDNNSMVENGSVGTGTYLNLTEDAGGPPTIIEPHASIAHVSEPAAALISTYGTQLDFNNQAAIYNNYGQDLADNRTYTDNGDIHTDPTTHMADNSTVGHSFNGEDVVAPRHDDVSHTLPHNS